MKIIQVTPENVEETGLMCVKNKKAPGYKAKVSWFRDKLNEGLKMQTAFDENGKEVAFIEYIPSEKAWRPVKAGNYMFIHCIGVFSKDLRNNQLGSKLIKKCEEDAKAEKKNGVCVMTSDGVWMADSSLFIKNGYRSAGEHGRFQLMVKKFKEEAPDPEFFDWTHKQYDYQGWNLIYSDQCPWHHKSAVELKKAAESYGIDLKVRKLKTPEEAQSAPSGFGTFSLLYDGKLLEDHYLSRRRFQNILNEKLNF